MSRAHRTVSPQTRHTVTLLRSASVTVKSQCLHGLSAVVSTGTRHTVTLLTDWQGGKCGETGWFAGTLLA